MTPPATYTITDVVGEPREWEGKFGRNLSYKLTLKDVEGLVELSQKPETPAPTVGQELEGEIQPSNGSFPPRFKKAQRNGPGFGGGGGMSPEREKRIVRQHSQSMSIETLKLAIDCGIDLGVKDVAGLVQKVKVLADVYDGDAGV